MKLGINSCNYRTTVLYRDEARKNVAIHRIVAIAFIPNPDDLPQIDHLDGDRGNNHVSNLEWVTAQENVKRAYANGLHPSRAGESNPAAKLTKSQIDEILALQGTTSQEDIAKLFDIHQTHVSRILRKVSWR